MNAKVKTSNSTRVRINGVLIDLERNTFRTNGEEFRIEPKLADLLKVLVDNINTVMTRDVLIDEVWDGAYGADQSLTNAISHLRKILEQDSGSEDIIKTVPKRGYSLVAPVSFIDDVLPADNTSISHTEGPVPVRVQKNRGGTKLLILSGIIALIAVSLYQVIPKVTPDKIQETSLAVEKNISEVNPASIAVLPFADISEDGKQTYFADGISEEILNTLASIDDLKVASRTSSFSFRNAESLRIPEIAEILGVRHILEGSVRRSGETIRVTAQLIDARTDQHLWSDTFERTLSAENIFSIQDEVSQAIMTELSREILPETGASYIEVKPDTDSLGAYDAYLKGREVFKVRNTENTRKAIAEYERAVELDPKFARAWASLAAAYRIAPTWVILDRDYGALANVAAERALELDPSQVTPLGVLGLGEIEKNPANYSKAFEYFNLGLERDPDSYTLLIWRGISYVSTGFFDLAEADFETCLENSPGDGSCRNWLAMAKLCGGDVDGALKLFEESAANGTRTHMGVFAKAYAAKGDRGSAIITWAWDFDGQSFDLNRLYRAHTDPGFAYDLEARAYEAEYITENGREPNWGKVGAIDAAHTFKRYDTLEPYWWYPIWWLRMHEDFMSSPERKRLIREHGLLDFWQENGFPPLCRPLGTDDFICD